MPEQRLTTTESQESSPSPPSPSSQSPAWWRAPERVLAILAAVGLRAFDKLESWEAMGVLMAAFGAPAVSLMKRGLDRLRGK